MRTIQVNADQFAVLKEAVAQIRRQSRHPMGVEQLASLCGDILAAAERMSAERGRRFTRRREGGKTR